MLFLQKFTSIEEKSETEITVGASVFLPDLSRYFKENVYSNGEFLIGIPGTVGGAVKNECRSVRLGIFRSYSIYRMF